MNRRMEDAVMWSAVELEFGVSAALEDGICLTPVKEYRDLGAPYRWFMHWSLNVDIAYLVPAWLWHWHRRNWHLTRRANSRKGPTLHNAAPNNSLSTLHSKHQIQFPQYPHASQTYALPIPNPRPSPASVPQRQHKAEPKSHLACSPPLARKSNPRRSLSSMLGRHR